jgi:anthranilate/para-aminobenzoate synthase component II
MDARTPLAASEIVGFRHKALPIEAQFHPESILTEHGHTCCAISCTKA